MVHAFSLSLDEIYASLSAGESESIIQLLAVTLEIKICWGCTEIMLQFY